jgi:membrane protease YdiL (CAAX protease family)
MFSHILIPEWRAYLVAIIVLFSLSSMSIAAKLKNDAASAARFTPFLQSYVALMAGIAMLGAASVGVPALLPPTFIAASALTGAGIAAGILAVAANRLILRTTSNVPGLATTHRADGGDRYQHMMRLILLTATAILEEVLFRGYLVTFAFWLPNQFLVVTALVLSVICFGAAHIYGGPENALGKLPLGALTLLLALGSGLLWPAIVAHVCFNLMGSRGPVAQQGVVR